MYIYIVYIVKQHLSDLSFMFIMFSSISQSISLAFEISWLLAVSLLFCGCKGPFFVFFDQIVGPSPDVSVVAFLLFISIHAGHPYQFFTFFFGPVLKQKWICTFDFDQPGVACPAVPIDWAAWQRNVTRAMMETSNAPLYYNVLYGGFPKWGYPKNGWFILDIPNIKWMVYTGVVHPYFRKPPCI